MRIAVRILCLLLLSSCSLVQVQQPFMTNTAGGDVARVLRDRCESLFAPGTFQQVHSIRFSKADGRGATVLGVTVRDGDTLKCGLMGVEGFVLFEAELGESLKIERALPPFDNSAFAAGLMEDVQTLFLLPDGDVVNCGTSSEGEQLCRYEQSYGRSTDIIVSEGDTFHINVYDDKKRRVKNVVFRSFTDTAIGRTAGEIELTVPGSRGYTLTMNLISAEKI